MIERGASRYLDGRQSGAARKGVEVRGQVLQVQVCIMLAVLCLAPAASCGAQAGNAAALKIAASIFPVATIAQEIGGDKASVTTIVPAGSDPHNFELTPTTARALQDAQLVFLIGGHFDGWIPTGSGPMKPSRLRSFMPLFEDSLIRTGDEINPHFWLDPLFAKRMGLVMARDLAEADPADSTYYLARAATFAARVDSLHASVKARLAESGFDQYVAFHPAWTYFARRYGLAERGILEMAPEQEPSARWVAAILKTIKDYGVKFIVAEEFSNKVLARMLAGDSGAEVIVLDPIGGTGIPGRDSYFHLMNYNLSVIEHAAGPGRGN
jgi:zinc transport system substrate-binding protein